MDARHLAAQACQQFECLLAANVAAHVGQHLVADVLQGDVQVAAHVVAARHHGQDVIGELGGVGIVQADPFHALYVGHAVDEFGQHHASLKVHAVGRQVLRDDVELFHAAIGQTSHLVEQLLHGYRRVTAGNQWNGAEGAKPVAAFRDFQVAIVAGGGQVAFMGQVVAIGVPQVSQHAFPVKFAVETVHLGQRFDEVGTESLAQATHHKQVADFALALGLAQAQDRVDRLLLGVGDKAACVDHHNLAVNTVGIVCHAVARSLQLAHQVLAVHKILGTAQRDDVNLVPPHESLDFLDTLDHLVITLDAEQRFHKLTLVENLQVGHLLSQADVFHGNLELVANADDHASLGSAVELGDSQGVDLGSCRELLGLLKGVLARRAVKHEQHLLRSIGQHLAHGVLDLGQLVHQAHVVVQAAGGVDRRHSVLWRSVRHHRPQRRGRCPSCA